MPSRETFAYRRKAQLNAARAVEVTEKEDNSIYAKAANDFPTFCVLMDKAPAPHMMEWHRHLITGESNRYLLDIAGANLDILSPRGSAKSTVLNLFTAWAIGRHTSAQMPLQIIYCSYNIATAIPKSRIIKQLIDNTTFKRIFPRVRLKPGMQSDIGWAVDFEYAGIPRVGDEEYTLRAAGLRGSITSKRAHLCLTGDTLVLTDQGEQPIEKIYADPGCFRIAVRNSKTNQVDWSNVAAVTRRCSSEIVHIRTTNNCYISATPEHPFLTTDQRYEWAGDISAGQTLVGISSCASAESLSRLRSEKTTHSKTLYKLLAKSRKISNRNSMSLLSRDIYGYVVPFSSEAKHRTENSVLFQDLCGGNETNFKTSDVSVLQQKISANVALNKVLFPSVCRFESFQKNDRHGQCKLSAWGLYRRLQETEKDSFKSGQFYVCRMQYEGKEVIYKRRNSSDKFVCSSYRSRSGEQHSLQSCNSLSSVPRGSSSDHRQSWETLTVSGVERVSNGTHIVYDLELDHTDHNFIANGFVVSNCLVDDPIKSSAELRNPTIREEMNNNWSSVISPIIFDGGRAICLGTRFHPLDIHKTMFSPSKGWNQVSQEALTYNNKGEPVSYWPEQWSVDYLLQTKELDPVAFAFQYQQQPVLTSDLIVSPDLLVRADVEMEFDSLAVGIDLSASAKETSDYTAFVLGGRLKDKYYIIDAHQCRSVGNLEKIDLLCEMLLEWGILTFENDTYFPTYSTITLVVESVAYQASLSADLKRVLLNDRGLSNIHIHEVSGFRGDKVARFRGTLGLLENRKITFNRYRKFDALFEQIINVGSTSHDDLLDAYTHLITFLQRRGSFSIEY
jgi:phage terminase large subunit-like protein